MWHTTHCRIHHIVTKTADAQQTLTFVLMVLLCVIISVVQLINFNAGNTKQEGQEQADWYRQASARLEHLKRVDNPLIVRTQQRTDVLPRGIAQPLGHASPAPFFTDHLKASFICHNLEHTGRLLVKTCAWQWIHFSPSKENAFNIYLWQAEKIEDASFNMWDFQGGGLDLPEPGYAVQVIKLHSGLRLK